MTATRTTTWPAGLAAATWRGRISSNLPADMPLSGPENWDDLHIRIDPAANTSGFLFNGASFGPISRGPTPTADGGAIRLERLDRATAGNDLILFNHLTIGAVETAPRGLWPFITNSLVTTNAQTTFSTEIFAGSRFYRLRKP